MDRSLRDFPVFFIALWDLRESHDRRFEGMG